MKKSWIYYTEQTWKGRLGIYVTDTQDNSINITLDEYNYHPQGSNKMLRYSKLNE